MSGELAGCMFIYMRSLHWLEGVEWRRLQGKRGMVRTTQCLWCVWHGPGTKIEGAIYSKILGGTKVQRGHPLPRDETWHRMGANMLFASLGEIIVKSGHFKDVWKCRASGSSSPWTTLIQQNPWSAKIPPSGFLNFQHKRGGAGKLQEVGMMALYQQRSV